MQIQVIHAHTPCDRTRYEFQLIDGPKSMEVRLYSVTRESRQSTRHRTYLPDKVFRRIEHEYRNMRICERWHGEPTVPRYVFNELKKALAEKMVFIFPVAEI